MFKKLLALAVILAVFLGACSKEAKPNDPARETAEDVTAEAEEKEYSMVEDRQKVPDNIEDEDMGGMPFRVVYRNNHYIKELFIEEETGENVEDAIYLRNKKVEERFNINFVESQ